jgi:hypothetical protein
MPILFYFKPLAAYSYYVWIYNFEQIKLGLSLYSIKMIKDAQGESFLMSSGSNFVKEDVKQFVRPDPY